jgi:hypothetical protein
MLLAPLLITAATAGCVPACGPDGCVQTGYATPVQPGYAPQPGYAVEEPLPPEPTYYDDRPAVIYSGQPAYLILDPSLGWGWRDPYQRWHSAPPAWRDRLDHGGYRGGPPPAAYRPQPGYRPEPNRGPQPGYPGRGPQQGYRPEPGRGPQPQGRPGRPEQANQGRPGGPPQQQRPAPPPRQENQRRVCPPGQLVC